MTDWVLIDEPAPHVKRITMNRPEKRNALNHPLRGAILEALYEGDNDDDVHVQIIRGAGPSFSAGYDLGDGNEGHEYPFYTPGGDGQWPRHVTEGWMSIWDLAKPVIAQVHGYCLAGGSELATGCDLVVHGRGRADGLPGGALRRARHALPRVVPRHAPGHGDDGHRRLDQRHRGGAPRAGPTVRSRPTSSTRRRAEVRRAHRRAAARGRAAQQAGRAPPDGLHGHAHAASGPAPSCARSAPTPRRWPTSSATPRRRASPAPSPSATPSSATTAPADQRRPPRLVLVAIRCRRRRGTLPTRNGVGGWGLVGSGDVMGRSEDG